MSIFTESEAESIAQALYKWYPAAVRSVIFAQKADWYIRNGDVRCADHHHEVIEGELDELGFSVSHDEDEYAEQYDRLVAQSIEIPQAFVDEFDSLECCVSGCTAHLKVAEVHQIQPVNPSQDERASG